MIPRVLASSNPGLELANAFGVIWLDFKLMPYCLRAVLDQIESDIEKQRQDKKIAGLVCCYRLDQGSMVYMKEVPLEPLEMASSM